MMNPIRSKSNKMLLAWDPETNTIKYIERHGTTYVISLHNDGTYTIKEYKKGCSPAA